MITYNGQELQATEVKIEINRAIDTPLEDYIPLMDRLEGTINGKYIHDLTVPFNRKIVFNCTEDMMVSLRILKPKSSITFVCGDYKIPCIITRRDYKRKKLHLLEKIC